ncbi:MAG: nucleotidyltransferase domain-containing protein, partial [Nanoarchaeota archaeon]|nr:nucleotidyltransferase domain-containing protein [Nanoarchaeota archaeon]
MGQINEKEIKQINTFISHFSSKNEILPLLLVESGSRMWGFASLDSDFDVRGLHLTSLTTELSISKNEEQFEYLKELMDVVSYDINKHFNLLISSNPNLLEQLQSDIVYINNFSKFGINYKEFKKKIFSLVNLKSLFYHYISMAHKNYDKYILSENKFTYKKSLYVLRSLFCAKYIIEKEKVPPVI